jgi:hypothetical protein
MPVYDSYLIAPLIYRENKNQFRSTLDQVPRPAGSVKVQG